MSKRGQECGDSEAYISVVPSKRKREVNNENNDPQGRDEKRKLAHDAYTVGWVCILRSELNASRALLDEEHDRLPNAEKDDNSYLLGRMGEHNVAIAFSGLGSYGTSSAARTATNMVRTFRKIRFGLMVGVGGGAPKRTDNKDPLKDIQLGDVVVSTPRGSHGKQTISLRLIRLSIWHLIWA